MANFDNIIQEINTNLPDNTSQAITATKLRTTLIDLTNTIETNQDEFESGLVVDSLSSTDTTKALSANQGNVLDGKISEIKSQIEVRTIVNPNNSIPINGRLLQNGSINIIGSAWQYFIYNLDSNKNYVANLSVVGTTASPALDYCGIQYFGSTDNYLGYEVVSTTNKYNFDFYLTPPSGATYCYIQTVVYTGYNLSQLWSLETVTDELENIKDDINDLDSDINNLNFINDNFSTTGTIDLVQALNLQVNANTPIVSNAYDGWFVFRGTISRDTDDNCLIVTKNSQDYGGIRTQFFNNYFNSGAVYHYSCDIKVSEIYNIRFSNSIVTSDTINKIFTPIDTSWHTYTFDIEATSSLPNIIQIGFNTNAPSGTKIYIRNLSITADNYYSMLETSYNVSKNSIFNLNGKKISIIGDSISCFGTETQTRTEGYNAPYWIVKTVDVGQQIQAYVTWLDVYNTINAGSTQTGKTIGGVTLTPSMIGTLQTFTPVAGDVGKEIGVARWASAYTTKPWWQVVIDKTGATLCNNASWSGSRLIPIPEGNTRHDAFVMSEAYSEYTLGRVRNRDDEGNFIIPDIIFIYRGVNDFVANDPEGGTGDPTPESIETPNMITFNEITDTNNFTQAYIWTILKLREKYPNTYIFCCTLNVCKQKNYSHYPSNNGTYTQVDYNNKIREIANLMGCGIVEFDKDGITFENCYPTFISDNATTPLHPNTNGHRVMGEKAVSDIKYKFEPNS